MISKERFGQIALEVAVKLDCYDDYYFTRHDAIQFAHTLLKKVQAECEVVGYRFDKGPVTKIDTWPHGGKWKKLIALPLVESEE